MNLTEWIADKIAETRKHDRSKCGGPMVCQCYLVAMDIVTRVDGFYRDEINRRDERIFDMDDELKRLRRFMGEEL